MMYRMDLAQNTGTTELHMKDNTRTESNVVMVHSNGLTGQNTLESFWMETWKDRVSLFGMMDVLTLGSGRTISCMDME